MLLYGWQTHPSTRRYARNPHPPTLAEHCEWFYTHLGSADCMILIILLGDKPAGCLRLDRLLEARSPAWELSINIAPEYVRLGLARAALRLAQSAIPGAELIAHVMPRNHASHALFKAAGFQHGSDGYYRFVCAN